MNKILNIVSFDVPYPPNYGGAIDVYYKLKFLNKLGVKIILHTYEYGRGTQKKLDEFCDKTFYYKRKKSLIHLFSKTPFIVNTRTNKQLIINLKSNNYPILFEGLHCTYPLLTQNFNNRITLVRAHNIEHNYYKGLAKSESSKIKRMYFNLESYKLLHYQSVLKKTNHILTISPLEQKYFSTEFPFKSLYIPAFHQSSKLKSKKGHGTYALYHGDIGIADNLKACNFLVEIFSKSNRLLIIASSKNNLRLEKTISKFSNIKFEKIKSNNDLKDLISSAHINVLPTFQNTGIKLKLINALFNGRFCLVNDAMIKKTGLEKLCTVANTKNEFREKIEFLFQQKFTTNLISNREKVLTVFNNITNAKKIIDLLF